MDATTRNLDGVMLDLCKIYLKRQRGNLRGEWVVGAIYKDFLREENQGVVATYHPTLKKALRYIRDGAKYLVG